MNTNLPSLKKYRSAFEDKGLIIPLSIVDNNTDGLLKVLPPAQNDKIGWPWNEEVNPNIYDKNVIRPKFTIVTPSYNQGAFIEQTIRSVLLQNYPNLEYIVIDGGSTDNTIEILKKYSPWISYWQSEKDNGQSHAINLGFSLASGDYYGWINSDDYYTETAFSHLVSTISDLPTKNFFYGWGYTLELISQKRKFESIKPRLMLKRHIRIPALTQPSCFWHRSINEPIWEDLICSMDYELWVRIFPKSNPYYIKEYLSVALVHGEAKTQSELFKKHWESDHKKIIEKHGAFSYISWKWINLEIKILSRIIKA